MRNESGRRNLIFITRYSRFAEIKAKLWRMCKNFGPRLMPAKTLVPFPLILFPFFSPLRRIQKIVSLKQKVSTKANSIENLRSPVNK